MQEPTTTTNLPIKLEPIVQAIQAFDALYEKSEKAEERLKAKHEELTNFLSEWDGEDSEDLEIMVNGSTNLLTKAKEAYDIWNQKRTEITGPLDELKKQLMIPEKRVAYDGKTDNYYSKLRSTLQKIQQIKLEKVKRAQAEAARKTALENYKVDLGKQMKRNLVDMVKRRVVEVHENSIKFFNETTLADFDTRAKQYKGFKAKLQRELYDKCFSVTHNNSITDQEYKDLVVQIQKEETFEKWEALTIEGIEAVLIDFRGRIPQIKEEKIAFEKAGEEERIRLADEKAKEEELKRQQIDQAQRDAEKMIEQDAELDKMNNTFHEQAVVQSMPQVGATKKVVRCTEKRPVVKALSTSI